MGTSWVKWGTDLDPEAEEQIDTAAKLPISVGAALMPDAHIGYGLPIGGVLATRDAVIPYGVGVDIACRVKMSVLDGEPELLEKNQDMFKKAIEQETRFGIGAEFKKRRVHPVMDRDWSVSPVTKKLKDKAWAQLGTSGSGNHFVEFGRLKVNDPRCGLKPGVYLALLSHSGSRGTGAKVCDYYSRVAAEKHPEMKGPEKKLGWLSLSSHEGQEYWKSMELMGEYAAANHYLIHKHLAQNLGAQILISWENHHNFAWKEKHGGEEVIVHRKGATPAGKGVIGIIPGSMASPCYVVMGKGNPRSFCSSAHGAGRRMSRRAAKKQFNWHYVNRYLKEKGVQVISAGLDEVPMVYKDIDEVMRAQSDLVEPLAEFFPIIVKMAPAGERPED